MKIKVAGIMNDSIVDGPGLRLTVFAQGCPHNCQGCHNPETHDELGGYYIEIDEIVEMAKKNPLLSGVTLSGGEPFMQVAAFSELAATIKKLGLNVIVYTGFLWEELMANSEMLTLVKNTDYIVDGKFDSTKKTLDMPFVGSYNQRIIDVAKSFTQGKTVIARF